MTSDMGVAQAHLSSRPSDTAATRARINCERQYDCLMRVLGADGRGFNGDLYDLVAQRCRLGWE